MTNSDKVQALVDKLAKKQAKKTTKRKEKKNEDEDIYVPSLVGRMHPSRAAMLEEAEIKTAEARKRAIKASPDLKKLRCVRIDARTTIFISKHKSPEKARQDFLMRHAHVR